MLRKAVTWTQEHAGVVSDVLFAMFMLTVVGVYMKYRTRIRLSEGEETGEEERREGVASGIATVIMLISRTTAADVHRLLCQWLRFLIDLSSRIAIVSDAPYSQ